ncbi:MAG: TIGR02757 family protein [bacterium]
MTDLNDPNSNETLTKPILWQDSNFNWLTIIDGTETFVGRGRDIPYPLEENDCWTLPNGKTFLYKNGKIKPVESLNQNIKIKECLEDLYEKFEESFLYSDPLGFVHKFNKTRDIEIAGFIAAGFAFGNVSQILKILEKIDKIVNHNFYDFILNFKIEDGFKQFKGIYYRFIKENDFIALFYILSEIIKQYGSIEKFFMEGYVPIALNLKESIVSFSERALKLVDYTHIYGSPKPPKDARVHFFFTSPLDNSPCKRLNLYLRWMVRNSDNLDFGIWSKISPAQLIMPVDTHISRICRYIGLTNFKNPSFKMALEITENLKKLDYFDPIKYDFAITRLGILDLCTKSKNEDNCKKCSIFHICNLN